MTILLQVDNSNKTMSQPEPGHLHNGSWFVFCAGDCPFVCEPSPTSADAGGEATGCNAGCQEVSRCSTRGGSQGMYITFASSKMNKVEPTLALKPRGNNHKKPHSIAQSFTVNHDLRSIHTYLK